MSYDHGRTNYQTSSELGEIQPKYVVTGTGLFISDPLELAPRNIGAENTYWGVYFSDAIDVTKELTVTVGGRYNRATIQLEDNTARFPGLNATNTYERFNPMVGGNYKLFSGMSLYGGYSESNRAPTPAELGCAEPDVPVPHRKLPDRRSATGAGGRAHRRGWSARPGSRLRRPLHVVGGAVPHARLQ